MVSHEQHRVQNVLRLRKRPSGENVLKSQPQPYIFVSTGQVLERSAPNDCTATIEPLLISLTIVLYLFVLLPCIFSHKPQNTVFCFFHLCIGVDERQAKPREPRPQQLVLAQQLRLHGPRVREGQPQQQLAVGARALAAPPRLDAEQVVQERAHEVVVEEPLA